jgi:hypothetical protein
MLTSSGGYSANVEMYLVVQGQQLPLGQVGPAHCTLRQPAQFAPTTGEIVIVVDGHETRVQAFFPDGASASDRRLSFVSAVAQATGELSNPAVK